jgi:hypothetical protein
VAKNLVFQLMVKYKRTIVFSRADELGVQLIEE